MAVYRPKYRDRTTGKLVESRIWWCEFSFAGKRYRESTKSTRKTLAIEYEKRRKLELERKYVGSTAESAAKARVRTVAEALKAYRAGYTTGHREKSIAWVAERSAHLEKLLGPAAVFDLTETRIRGYIKTRLGEGAGHRTVNMELDTLARAIGGTWRALWPAVPKLEEPRDVGRALAPDEEGRILGAAMRNKSPLVYRFIETALQTGMRAGEIRTLQINRVDFRNGILRVGQAKTEAGSGRGIPMNPGLLRTLSAQVAWLKEKFGEPEPEWFLFPFSNRAKSIDPTRPVTTIKTAWESVKRVAGVECRFHDLRHTALTKLAEADVPESTVKALAGHLSAVMLERYSHVRLAAKQKAVESLTLATPIAEVPKDSPKVASKRRLRIGGK